MRQTILRVVCESCGCIAQFEIVNNNPLVACTDIGWMLDRHGWKTRAIEGASQFQTYDLCQKCAGATP